MSIFQFPNLAPFLPADKNIWCSKKRIWKISSVLSDISYSPDPALMFIPPCLSFLNYFCLVLIPT